ncbi:MAG: hypothetical protein PHE78_03770 [Candidatus Gastranaerophilales bacterium]|nr:hypothetical protein [Candidatus Gastranaerophilales bacterium]
MVYNSNDYCNAAQYSGASSDYMHMAPIYNVLGGGNNVYGGIFAGNGYGSYGYTGGYGYNTADKIALGIGAVGNIFAAIGMGKVAKEQALQQQAVQAMQYQSYQDQSAQLYQQQQTQLSQQNLMDMLQMMMMMKSFKQTTST